MRTPIIAGNWKMNKGDQSGATALAAELAAAVGTDDAVEVVLGPPFTALSAVAAAIKGSSIALAAQNMYPKESGAFTGEIAPGFLKDCGCAFVILGHSERRQYFHETDAFINEKVRCALAQGLKPILCCGETQQERESDQTQAVVERHVRGGLQDVSNQEMARVVIAYEPVWAIGTGLTASTQQAQEVHAFIRGLLTDLYGEAVATTVRIQYGGSVKADNAAALLEQPDIDGALVGGASLDAASFLGIIKGAGGR